MKKVFINIQIAVFCILSLITMMAMPFAKASWKAAGGAKVTSKSKGLNLLFEIFNKTVFDEKIADKSFMIRLALILAILLPLIFLLAHLLTALISIGGKQKRFLGILFSVIPFATCLIGSIFYKINAASCLKDHFGDSATKVSVGFGLGFFITIILLLLTAIEEIALVGSLTSGAKGGSGKKKGKKSKYNEPVDYRRDYGYPEYPAGDSGDYRTPGPGPADYRDPGPADYRDSGPAAYNEPAGNWDDYNAASDINAAKSYNDTISSFGESGPNQFIRCLGGEYEGASFPVRSSEVMYIGRDHTVCNIVLTNPRVSRKHGSIEYNPATDTFTVVNYSKNGIYVNGQRMDLNRPYQFPHGTIIKISDADLFQLQ